MQVTKLGADRAKDPEEVVYIELCVGRTTAKEISKNDPEEQVEDPLSGKHLIYRCHARKSMVIKDYMYVCIVKPLQALGLFPA